MTSADSILELLDDLKPKAYCDDCLSNELGIRPRQQVNQIANRLQSSGRIVRQKGVCASCLKLKTVSTTTQHDHMADGQNATTVPLQPRAISVQLSAVKREVPDFDIEHARTEVVRICHQVWMEHKQGPPPYSISFLINSLKTENIIPDHQANMMLTLCGLRNVYVYQNVKLADREMLIAQNALSIIQEWWQTNRASRTSATVHA